MENSTPFHTVVKRSFLFLHLLSLVTGLLGMVSGESPLVLYIFSAQLLAVSILGLTYQFYSAEATPLYCNVCIYMYATAYLLFDLHTITMDGGVRGWPYYIVLVDISLVCKLPRTAMILIGILLIWIVVQALELAFSPLGLYSLPILTSAGERMKGHDCGEIPCFRGIFNTFLISYVPIGVVLLAHHFTRGFATKFHTERAKMQSTIRSVEMIAKSLMRFDLEEAEETLDASTLPDELRKSFRDILTHLNEYRPFIPDQLFNRKSLCPTISSSISVSEHVYFDEASLVFTDIHDSTHTWDNCPSGMKRSLDIHDNVIRSAAYRYEGYEVKTVGDTFMLAFENCVDACRFGLTVQERLLNSKWPKDLTDLSFYAWDNDGPWCGLRVRIGVHHGAVTTKLNEVTQRIDYFGDTVNTASRMERECVGGSMAVTSKVLQLVAPSHDLDDDDFETGLCEMLGAVLMIPMDGVSLKGSPSPVDGFVLIPEAHGGRRQFIEEQLFLDRNDRNGMSTMEKAQLYSKLGAEVSHVSNGSYCKADIVSELYTGESFCDINEVVLRVMSAAVRSEGVLMSVQGSTLDVSWNISRPCVNYIENSFKFLELLREMQSKPGFFNTFVGLSNGLMYGGTLGRTKQRFFTVHGTCVALASSLLAQAATTKTLCLYCSLIPNSIDDELEDKMEHVTDWKIRQDGEMMNVSVFQFDSRSRAVSLPLLKEAVWTDESI